MAGQPEQFESCNACGATVYPEHLQKGLAERADGKIVCAHCLKVMRAGPTAPAAVPTVGAPPEEPIALVEVAASREDDEPIAYDRKPTAIRSFGGGPGAITDGIQHVGGKQYNRSPLKGSANATRCRVFHAKLADAAFGHMCEQINEWVDANDEVEIKFVSSCIGVVEGKHADQHLIVTVFY